jgi:hypothetical protein
MSTTHRITPALWLVGACAAALVAGCSSSSGTPAAASGPPACTSSGKNAYDTYGTTAFLAVNASIFANVGTEITKNSTKNLGTSFTLIGKGKPGTATADDAATFQTKLGNFLVYAYGGPSNDGASSTDLAAAHAGLGITMDQYNYFVSSIVVPALTTNGVKSEDVSSCFAPVLMDSSVVDAVVGQ